MTIELGRYGSREIMDFQIFDYKTKKPLMTFDYANSSQTENKAETTYARGGSSNPRRIAWHGDKETTVTIETQIFTMEHLAMFAGQSIVTGASDIYKSEVVAVESDGDGGKQITLSKTPFGGLTDVAVFKYVNGVIDTPQAITTITNTVLTLDSTSTVAVGDEVEVYYRWKATDSKKLSFTTKGFPPYVFLVGDTVYADEVGGEMVSAQLKYYKAKLQPNFTLSNAPTGDPSSLSLVFDIFPVKVDGEDTLYDMTIYQD
jgi:hypothetical protein